MHFRESKEYPKSAAKRLAFAGLLGETFTYG